MPSALKLRFKKHPASGPRGSLEDLARHARLLQAVSGGKSCNPGSENSHRATEWLAWRGERFPGLQRIPEVTRRGRKTGGSKQPHKVATREAICLTHLVKKLPFIWIGVEPVSLVQCLHQLAKERSFARQPRSDILKIALPVCKQIYFTSVRRRSDLR